MNWGIRMTEKDIDLDMFFAAAQREPLAADPAFLARVLTDAEAAQGARVQAVAALAPKPKRHPWRMFMGVLGGWPAIGGLATAAVAGVWIGVSSVDPVSTQVMTYFGGSDTTGLSDELTQVAFDLNAR